MSQVTDPVMLDSTGQIIVSKLQDVIDAINGGTIDPLTVTQNGTYTPSGTTLGYGPVTVNVGGGGENAYAETTPPSASVGQNGDYYFELSTDPYTGLIYTPTDSAAVTIGGWEFTANQNITVVGARGYARASYAAGTIKLADSAGNVLAEKSISLVASTWVSVMFDAPVSLTAGSNYIIMLFGGNNTLTFTRNPITTSPITYVRGRYNSLPGSIGQGTAYSADVIFGTPPYPVKTAYYKDGGVWAPV